MIPPNMTAGKATRASGDFPDFDRYLSWPKPSKPFAAPALSLARLHLEPLAGWNDWRRLHLELAKQVDLFAKTCFSLWRFAEESLQSLADLLRDSLTVGMVNINSVAHEFPDSTPVLGPQALETETAAFGYLRERSLNSGSA